MLTLIKTLLITVLIVLSKSQISNEKNYAQMDGTQVYFIMDNTAFLYSTLSGNSTQITITTNLFLANNNLDSTSGLFAGISFGKTQMKGMDIVLFTYTKGSFGCSDYYAPGNLIASDISAGGSNDVTFVTGAMKALDTTYSPYTTKLSWTCTKNISKLDSFDWTDFANWKTNNGAISGTWNFNTAAGGPQQHQAIPRVLQIVDGAGLTQITPVVPSTVLSAESLNSPLFFLISLLFAILI